jgi:hypothetical protein
LMMEVVPHLKIRGRRRRRSLSADVDWRRARSSAREWSSSRRRQRNWLIDQNPRGSSRRRRRCCCCYCCFRREFGWQEDATDGTSGLFLQPRIHARSVEDVAADEQLTKHLGRRILH